MTPEIKAQVVQSFRRCQDRPGFLDRFYEMFLASSPEVRAKFQGTDFNRQRQMLEESLLTLLAADGVPATGPIRDHLERIAARHSRSDRDVGPALYDVWLDCLVRTVRERDPQITPVLEQAWRDAVKPGIEFLRARYSSHGA